MDETRILIAVPTFESIKAECFKSIYDLETPKNCLLDFNYVKGYDCAKARNEIAKQSIENNYDYVFMVDSDIILPSSAIIELMKCKSDIALGWYFRKKTQSDQTIIFNFGKDFNDDNCIKGDTMQNHIPDIIDVKGGGLGIALIKTNVFKDIDYPYFRFVTYKDNTVLSEDLYFCVNARDKNKTIKCNPLVKGVHIFDIMM